MVTLTKRSVLGRPLHDTEFDANMTALESALTTGAFATSLADPTAAAAVASPLGWVNVLAEGAADGDTTDYASVINAAATKAQTQGKGLLFPKVATGYRADSTVTVPLGVPVRMLSPLIFHGTGTAMAIGSTGTTSADVNFRMPFVLWVKRSAQSDWSDNASPTEIGVLSYNANRCTFDIQVENFTVGLKAYGHGQGWAYNSVFPRYVHNNQVGILFYGDTSATGYANQNSIRDGSIRCDGSLNSSITRYAVMFPSGGSNSTANTYNNNKLDLTSIELNNITLGIPFYFQGICEANRFVDYRSESNSGSHAQTDSLSSARNWLLPLYTDPARVPSVAGSGAGVYIRPVNREFSWGSKSVWTSGNLAERAYPSGASILGLLGISQKGSGDATHSRTRTTMAFVTATDGGPELSTSTGSSGRAIGGRLRLVNCRRYLIRITGSNRGNTNGVQLYIAPFDSTGTLRSNQTGDVVRLEAAATPAWSSGAYGGAWALSETDLDPGLICVEFPVAMLGGYADLSLSFKTTSTRIRAFDIVALEGGDPVVFEGVFGGCNLRMASAVPSGSFGLSWPQGMKVFNSAYAGSGTTNWQCSAAGDPGTWVALTG